MRYTVFFLQAGSHKKGELIASKLNKYQMISKFVFNECTTAARSLRVIPQQATAANTQEEENTNYEEMNMNVLRRKYKDKYKMDAPITWNRNKLISEVRTWGEFVWG